jgi:hypothetical protein
VEREEYMVIFTTLEETNLGLLEGRKPAWSPLKKFMAGLFSNEGKKQNSDAYSAIGVQCSP